MDWGFIFTASSPTRPSAPSAVVYCLAAIGLNIQFGYTGLLNFGQAAFLAVAGYGMAVDRHHVRASASGSGIVVGLVARRRAGAAARYPDPAAARRLPRHRDDRGRRDRPAARPLGDLQGARSAARTACSSSPRRFYDLNPLTDDGPDRVRPVHVQRPTSCG